MTLDMFYIVHLRKYDNKPEYQAGPFSTWNKAFSAKQALDDSYEYEIVRHHLEVEA